MTQLKNIKDDDTWLYEEFLQDEIKVIGVFLIDYIGSIFKAREDWVDRPHFSFYGNLRKLTNFLEQIEKDDKLLNFDGFPFMGMLSGRAGYVIMRDGKVVDVYVTRMS
jgi:hypothetical protein